MSAGTTTSTVLERISSAVNLLRRRSSTDSQSSSVSFENVDIGKPIYQGRVFKQTKEKDGFNKRFFVLYPGILLYYKHERDYHKDLKSEMVKSY